MATLLRKKHCDTAPEKVGYDSATIERLDRHLGKIIEDDRYYCGSYALVKDDQLIAYTATGSRRPFESDKPFQSNTIRRIASVTKIFTSVAVFQLLEQGLLHLHQPVSEILPVFDTGIHRDITIWHLLTHTSGLPADGGAHYEPYRRDLIQDMDNWMENFLSGPLYRQPGKEWAYSTLGMGVLGEIITAVSGVNYEDYIQRHILKPLGMNRTFFRVPPELMDEVACGSPEEKQWIEEKWAEKDKGVTPPWFAGGGISSTTDDLILFSRMLMNKGSLDGNRILSRKSVEVMTTNALSENTPSYSWGDGGRIKEWGLGFDLYDTDPLSTGAFGHEGAGRCGICMHGGDGVIFIHFVSLYEDEWQWDANIGFRTLAWSGLL